MKLMRGAALLSVALLAVVVTATPAAAEPFEYHATDLPKAIPDPQPGPGIGYTYSEIFVPYAVPGTVVDLNVMLSLEHGWTAELDVWLKHLDTGTKIKLYDNLYGGAGPGLIDTVFDDEALIPISAGTLPFTGTYRPDVPLSTFNGEILGGTWQLIVRDDGFATNGRGILNSFSINGIAANPEPGSMALLGLGLAGMAGYVRRRRQQKKAA